MPCYGKYSSASVLIVVATGVLIGLLRHRRTMFVLPQLQETPPSPNLSEAALAAKAVHATEASKATLAAKAVHETEASKATLAAKAVHATEASNATLAAKAVNESKVAAPPGRILMYVTTHLSSHHVTWLKCWPAHVWPSLPRLHYADVLMYVSLKNGTAEDKSTAKSMAITLLAAWPNPRKSLQFDDNPGYQRGAMKAMWDAVRERWFKGYDWVIRINPDVLIYDEKPTLRLMEPASTWAVLCNCRHPPRDSCLSSGCTIGVVHTDFLVVRPEKLRGDAFADWRTFRDIAEMQAAQALKNIVDAKADAWLMPRNELKVCRVNGQGLWHQHLSCNDLLAKRPWLKQ